MLVCLSMVWGARESFTSLGRQRESGVWSTRPCGIVIASLGPTMLHVSSSPQANEQWPADVAKSFRDVVQSWRSMLPMPAARTSGSEAGCQRPSRSD